jgi:hypothetical protein
MCSWQVLKELWADDILMKTPFCLWNLGSDGERWILNSDPKQELGKIRLRRYRLETGEDAPFVHCILF